MFIVAYENEHAFPMEVMKQRAKISRMKTRNAELYLKGYTLTVRLPELA